ncbi:DUF192 domain-containing protein [Caloramator sp. CAR-1]|uniref:DUF192 domain-containing protein n=1 Tax=Caloramator sp. CAR-1 TaxID=3062777 RepID=UPI0026E18A7A|nr:DUF192 domain-containing protein [Caloramator sp. CAR-1]MDO6355982.1 DUF192 domain-containing protein [Caloramator sp. CAR-1]
MKEKVYIEGKVIEAYIADTFFKRLTGYMFRKRPHHEAILFKPCNSIHTFFMFFNIDVYLLDENMNVIKKIKNLTPWKILPPMKGVKYVLEVPAT